MSRRSEQFIRDFAVWFHENKDRGRDHYKELEFLHASIDNCILLCSHLLEDIQIMEGRGQRAPLLWTPSGMTWRNGED